MADTSIEWCDKVWNPVTGCSKVSAGCKNCYAERIAHRFWGERTFDNVKCHPDRLDQPLRWRKPQRIFVDSMGDLFHEAVPEEFVVRVFSVMQRARQHTFQVLTKRPDRMRDVVVRIMRPEPPLPNVWLGVSVENQKTAEKRIPLLLETPAAVRIVSCEPLLGPIDIEALWSRRVYRGDTVSGYLDYDDIDGVFVGGETGPGARAMDEDWVRSIRDQCVAADVPFFYKQRIENGRKVSLPLLDGRQWKELPARLEEDRRSA